MLMGLWTVTRNYWPLAVRALAVRSLAASSSSNKGLPIVFFNKPKPFFFQHRWDSSGEQSFRSSHRRQIALVLGYAIWTIRSDL
uniref:Uncharacterized protein n=1 Tax=Nelumbo nucifera TaxID=4432 RepID=A0A822Y3H5_NELNU|nr:TPA_asm: hypothetical protein HUJ06_029942 [Nelumbo nucifera]